MLGGLGHLGGHDALRAVQGREGLGELKHPAADGRCAFDQVDVVSGIGDIQSRLDSRNPAAYH
ncbi:hypothetical protein ES703_58887 [subsurface metagenome]